MAQNSIDFTIRIDSADAQKQLDEVNQKAQEVAEEASRVTGDGTPSAKPLQGGGQALAPARVESEKLGETAGKAIATFFVSQFLSSGISLAINSTRSAATSNTTQEIASKTASGAISGGMAGAMIGGGWGALAGGGIGLILSYLGARNDQRLKQEQAHLDNYMADVQGLRARRDTRNMMWEQELINLTPGLDQKMAHLREMYKQAAFGMDDNSLQSLRWRMDSLASNGKQDSAEYQDMKSRYSSQAARVASYSQQYDALQIQERRLAVGSLLQASEVTDALGAQGIQVGSSVNVSDVQQNQLNVLERILRCIERNIKPADVNTVNAFFGL